MTEVMIGLITPVIVAVILFMVIAGIVDAGIMIVEFATGATDD